jgi:FkbM family methyltransferase
MAAWLVRFAWRRIRRAPGPDVVTLSINRLLFTLDWSAAEHVPLREILGRDEYWPVPAFRPSPGQVVVDAGANAGVFSTVAASWIGPTGRLVAIEPNPLPASRLTRNLRQNGFADRSVVVERALSDHAGHATLYVGANSVTGTLSPAVGSSEPGIGVRVASLDSIAAELGLSDIDLLKMDVEGHETTVLRGAGVAMAHSRRAVIEVSNDDDVPAVMECCAEAGFDRVVRRPAGVDSGATIVFAERR